MMVKRVFESYELAERFDAGRGGGRESHMKAPTATTGKTLDKLKLVEEYAQTKHAVFVKRSAREGRRWEKRRP